MHSKTRFKPLTRFLYSEELFCLFYSFQCTLVMHLSFYSWKSGIRNSYRKNSLDFLLLYSCYLLSFNSALKQKFFSFSWILLIAFIFFDFFSFMKKDVHFGIFLVFRTEKSSYVKCFYSLLCVRALSPRILWDPQLWLTNPKFISRLLQIIGSVARQVKIIKSINSSSREIFGTRPPLLLRFVRVLIGREFKAH